MLLDAATLQKSAEMHPEVVQSAQTNPIPAVNWEDPPTVAGLLEALTQMNAAQLGDPEPAIIEETLSIPLRDGTSSTLYIHRPASPRGTGSPLIVHFFGGGWIGGSGPSAKGTARAWVRLFGATVVCASYRLAPQHKFPTSQFDCWDSVAWLDAHAEERLGIDFAKGFLVAGVSAGATNAAAVTAFSLEGEEGGRKLKHPITGQFLSAPSLMDAQSVPERFRGVFLALDQNVDAPVLPTSALTAIARHTESDAGSAWRYPVLSKAPLGRFPPTYFQVHGMDPLRDDGLIYEEMLKEAGVKTRIDFYPGCPHTHYAFVPGIEVSNRALADISMGVGWLLGETVTPEQGLGAYAKPS